MSKPSQHELDEMTNKDASTFLRLGLSQADEEGERRPVDDLLDRLGASDGAEWLQAALKNFLVGTMSLESTFLRAEAVLDDLRRIKSLSKKLRGSSGEPTIEAQAGYFLSLAAAVAHHGVLIGGPSESALRPIFEDLVAAVPEAWKQMLRSALQRLDGAQEV